MKKSIRALAVVWWLLFSSGIVVIPWRVLQRFSVLPGKCPWLHNFRFQSSFQILLAGNFHNFFVQFFGIFFPILFAGLVSFGCEGFMVPSFLHCFVSSSRTFGPLFLLEESDKQQIALHFSYIFYPRFLRFLALSVAAGFSVGDSPYPS
jgi:hypothetical protein